MRRSQETFFAVAVAVAVISHLAAAPAFAHAAEQGFVLLLPTTAYITAGTLAVAATMLLLLVLKPGQIDRVFRPYDAAFKARWTWSLDVVPLIASVCLGFLILIGFAGPSDPQENLLPLTLWTVWWMAFFVVQGLVFNVWQWINPWAGLHRLIQPDAAGVYQIHKDPSVWPAVVVFLGFQGFVLADAAPNDPDRLAAFALGYSVFTFLGMSLFGRDFWLRHVECFTVMFNLIGSMRVARSGITVNIGLPGWQVFETTRPSLSHAVFVLVILASGSFDGLHETFWWLDQLGVNPLEYPGRSAMIWKTSVGLYAAIGLLTAIFAGAVFIGVLAVNRSKNRLPVSFAEAFVRFSITLLPIAIGYHFAHYFVTFMVQIQFVIINLSDPLAAGWNLLGLNSTRVKVGFLAVPETVKVVWIIQAGVVVVSHILSVLLCHRTAELLCNNKRDIVKLQLGLSFLMVAYTIFGLWLLASPRGV